MDEAASTTGEKKRLPSPQGVALAITQACRRDDVSIAEISRLVQSDPALAGRLLQIANAASTGSRPTASVLGAVGRLGLECVRQLALSFSLIENYGHGRCAGFDYAEFWSHSLLMAVATRELNAALGLGSADELFSCGLLARVGCLGLATAYPDEYTELLHQGHQGEALLQQERRLLRTDHIALSSELHALWGLPTVLCEAMRFHEQPGAADFAQGSRPWQLAQVLHLAWRMADFFVHGGGDRAHRITELKLLAGALGLADTDFSQCADTAIEQWKQWGAVLNVRVTDAELFSTMTQAPLRPDQEPNPGWLRVLIVEDDAIVLRLLERWLRDECHYTVMTAKDGQLAMAVALTFQPHVVVTDWQMPVMDGLELCRTLRASDWGRNIYVLMLTSADSENDLVRAFDGGVDDYLTKPVNMRALSARLKAAWRFVRLRDAWERDHQRLTGAAEELALINRRLQHAALSDPLTELANRRAGLNALSQAWSASTRYGHGLSVIAIDVDYFKAVNDVHGHTCGDVVLQRLSENLRTTARNEDTVCRWGGEEFMLICPNMTRNEGLKAAERLRADIAGMRIMVDGKLIEVTISLGLATWSGAIISPDQLLAEADKALYAAKQGGRNRVATAPESVVAD